MLRRYLPDVCFFFPWRAMKYAGISANPTTAYFAIAATVSSDFVKLTRCAISRKTAYTVENNCIFKARTTPNITIKAINMPITNEKLLFSRAISSAAVERASLNAANVRSLTSSGTVGILREIRSFSMERSSNFLRLCVLIHPRMTEERCEGSSLP